MMHNFEQNLLPEQLLISLHVLKLMTHAKDICTKPRIQAQVWGLYTTTTLCTWTGKCSIYHREIERSEFNVTGFTMDVIFKQQFVSRCVN